MSSKTRSTSLRGHPVEAGVDVDVLAAGEVGMEAGAELEQRGQPAAHAHLAGGRREDAGDALEQRRLARPVVAEDADRLALLDHQVERRAAPGTPRSARDGSGRCAASASRPDRWRSGTSSTRCRRRRLPSAQSASTRLTSARSNALSAIQQSTSAPAAVMASASRYQSGPYPGSSACRIVARASDRCRRSPAGS